MNKFDKTSVGVPPDQVDDLRKRSRTQKSERKRTKLTQSDLGPDADAWDTRDSVLGYLLKKFPKWEDVSDVATDAIIEAWDYARKSTQPFSLALAKTIAFNRQIDSVRRQNRRHETVESDLPKDPDGERGPHESLEKLMTNQSNHRSSEWERDPEQVVLNRELAKMLYDLTRDPSVGLTDAQRAVLLLRFAGVPFETIAESLDISVGGARQRHARGLQTLRASALARQTLAYTSDYGSYGRTPPD